MAESSVLILYVRVPPWVGDTDAEGENDGVTGVASCAVIFWMSGLFFPTSSSCRRRGKWSGFILFTVLLSGGLGEW